MVLPSGWWRVRALHLVLTEVYHRLITKLWVRVFDREAIATAPWGARWVDDRTLAVFTADWERPATEVAPEVVEVAVASAGLGIRDT